MPIENSAIRKASLRLVPFLCLLYFVSYLDRVNISFAALQMNADVGISASAYGLGASMFFIGYLLFQIPSNLTMGKVGARRWIASIMITWGVVSASTVFVRGETSLYINRFLLGAAEAGFFPGAVVYMNHWFPRAVRARVVGVLFAAVPFSSMVGAPISTALLDCTNGLAGLQGWQWVFLLEGIPSMVCGCICLWYLTERPAVARWLTPEEAASLQRLLDREKAEAEAPGRYRTWEVFTNLRVCLLALVLLLTLCGSYGVGYWMPQIIRLFTTSRMEVGWLTSAIYLVAVIGMALFALYSDASGRRVAPVAVATALGGVGFLVCAAGFGSPVLAIAGLMLACIGTLAPLPIFWTLPPTFLTGTAAAVAIAFINSTAQFAGVTVPWLIGVSKDATGGFVAAIAGLGVALFLASGVVLYFGSLQTAQSAAGMERRATGVVR